MTPHQDSKQSPEGQAPTPTSLSLLLDLRGSVWGKAASELRLDTAVRLVTQAGCVTFGLAWERGGNVRNILTQQLPPPNSDGTWGRLTPEKMQMAIPPPTPTRIPLGCLERRAGAQIAFGSPGVSPEILGRPGHEW